jgi:transposase
MYITEVVRPYPNGKASRCILLRESYRENGKVKNRTLANLTALPAEALEALKHTLRQPAQARTTGQSSAAPSPGATAPAVTVTQGLSIGAVATVYQVAQTLGIRQVLGNSPQGKRALWQVIARVIQPGSCLASVRLAREHAMCDLLRLTDSFCEDDLYANLAWLSERQLRLEKALFRRHADAQAVELFLYDVTSSYLEGEHNVLGAYGYCRDKKRGKPQIVVGLLTDAQGEPVSVEVFRGNTSDVSTLTAQVRKLAQAFGCRRVTLVGDRGLIKQMGIEALQAKDFYFISAITKAQIETLLKQEGIEMALFDQPLGEVKLVAQADSASAEPRSLRYILKRNPVRAQELAHNRQLKKAALEKRLHDYNQKLACSRRAQLAVARRELLGYLAKLKLEGWLTGRKRRGQRQFYLIEDQTVLAEHSKLDGCYVIRTDLPVQAADAQTVHERYRDLANVEQGFRTCKTVHLEMRPWFVTCEASTRGHALVVMLAYKIVRYLAHCWKPFDIEVVEALEALKQITLATVHVAGYPAYQSVPIPRPELGQLLSAAGIELPQILPHLEARVVTRKNISESRK